MGRSRLTIAAFAFGLSWAVPAQACTSLSLYFGWNSARLSPESQAALERVAVRLAWKRPDLERVLLTSHTDTSGSPSANRLIALRRAEAVREVLLKHQVPPGLIEISVAGAAVPRVATAQGVREPRNRRVDLLVQMSASAQERQLADGQAIC